MNSVRFRSTLASITLLVLTLGIPAALAQEGPPGLTTLQAFPPFNANAPACSAPVGLSNVLAYVQENDREFLAGVDRGLAMAAKDRGLDYRKSLADSDIDKALSEIRAFTALKVGALIATSSNPAAVAPSLQEAIWSGEFVGTIVPPPATLLLNAPQYATGKALADAAADYINSALGGKANVVLFTQDSMQYLTPRFAAMRDILGKFPGVTIIADITPDPVTKQGGLDTMNVVLEANPGTRIDVVLGGDAVVLGALKALRAAGRDSAGQFLGGIDGEPEGVAEIKSGTSPFKASIALSSPVFGYAMGHYAADWLVGKSVPQAMDILPIALTKDNIAAYEADLADPASAFRDPVRRAGYLRMYGNICYDTRDQYVNFPWSSEVQ